MEPTYSALVRYFEVDVLLEHLECSVGIINKQGEWVAYNDHLKTLLGFQADASTINSFENYLCRNERDKWYSLIASDPESTSIQLKINNRLGEMLSCTAQIVKHQNNDHELTFLFIMDNSDSYQQEMKLAHSQALLQSIEAHLKIGSWEFNVNDESADWSEGVWSIFEQDKSKTLNYERFLKWVRPDFLDAHFEMNKRMADAYPGYQFEPFIYPIITPMGMEKWVRVHTEVEFDDDFNPTRFFGTIMDITDEIHRDQQLEQLKRATKTLNDKVNNIALESDAQQALESLNQIVRKLNIM